MSLSSIPRALRDAVFTRDEGRCRYCRMAQFGSGAMFHIDHVVPRSKGGPTTMENLVLQCPSCSLHKANKLAVVDPETADTVRLFHPLRDDWHLHFSMDPDGTCRGRTALGRATVLALKMNEPIPRIARSLQLALGIM